MWWWCGDGQVMVNGCGNDGGVVVVVMVWCWVVVMWLWCWWCGVGW